MGSIGRANRLLELAPPSPRSPGSPHPESVLANVPAIIAAAHFDHRIGRKPPKQRPLLLCFVCGIEEANCIGFEPVTLAIFSRIYSPCQKIGHHRPAVPLQTKGLAPAHQAVQQSGRL